MRHFSSKKPVLNLLHTTTHTHKYIYNGINANHCSKSFFRFPHRYVCIFFFFFFLFYSRRVVLYFSFRLILFRKTARQCIYDIHTQIYAEISCRKLEFIVFFSLVGNGKIGAAIQHSCMRVYKRLYATLQITPSRLRSYIYIWGIW